MENVQVDNGKLPRHQKITFNEIKTCSKEMMVLIEFAKKISQTEVSVLLSGESGTGKELFAQAIHNDSLRKNGPFVIVNCAGIPDTLLESELFGHEKGAFTDAISRKRGKFELANGGTLFLDEVGDLSPAAQAKTLRAVEEKQFERVGGEEQITANCRIIAATNRDLLKDVKAGKFRDDLYYRLNEAHIFLPPLRKRREDIPFLTDIFIKEFNRLYKKNIKGISRVTLEHLKKHDWPGNVRELRSLFKSAMSVIGREVIWLEDLPFHIELLDEDVMRVERENFSLSLMERRHILKTLNYTNWNKTQAAKLLEITRPTLDRKIKEYNLSKE